MIIIDSCGDCAGFVNCSSFFTLETYELLGMEPKCQIAGSYSLRVVLGESFRIRIGDFMTFEPKVQLFTSRYWDLDVQTNTYAEIDHPESWKHMISIDSFSMDSACLQLTLRDNFQSVHQLVVDDYSSVSDIEFMLVEGKIYCFVAQFCRGKFCLFDTSSAFRSNFQLHSPVYLWTKDDSLDFVQGISTNGVKDAHTFALMDAGENGPTALNHFLAVANFYADVMIWWFNTDKLQFSTRQIISATFPTSIDVFTDNEDVFLVIANTDPMNALSVHRWVMGEFKLNDFGKFVWVDGHFGESIQLIPVTAISKGLLYKIPDDSRLLLGISSYHSAGVGAPNRVELKLMIWNPSGCKHANGCFEPFMSLPAVGASTFHPFSVKGSDSNLNFVAVGNYFEGQTTSVVNSNFELASYIYEVNYSTKSFSLIQTVPTSGIWSILAFQVQDEVYLAFGNQRGMNGLSIPVRIYKFMRKTYSCPESSIPGPRFQYLADIQSTGATAIKSINRSNVSWLIVAQGAGLTSADFLRVETSSPVPQPIISASPAFGTCVGFTIDARASLNSVGAPFSVRWNLSSFKAAPEIVEMIRNSTLVVVAINDEVFRSDSLLLDVPIQYENCFGIRSNGLCFNDLFLPYGYYEISIYLTNWLGAVQSATHFFEKVSECPRIFIYGSSQIQTTSSSGLELILDTKPPCDSQQISSLEIEWQIIPRLDTFSSTDSNVLYIPRNSLVFGITYTINVTVAFDEDAPVLSSVTVKVLKSSPVAQITGGDRLVALISYDSLIINASDSYDPDRMDDKTHLDFSWICQQDMSIGAINVGKFPFSCDSISFGANQTTSSVLVIDQQKLLRRMISTSPIQGTPVFTTGCNKSASSPNPEFFPGLGLALCDSRSTFTIKVIACINDQLEEPGSCITDPCCDSSEIILATTPLEPPTVSIRAIQSSRISGSFDVAFSGSINRNSSDEVYSMWMQMVFNGVDYIPHVLNSQYVQSEPSSASLLLSSLYFESAGSYTFRLYATYQRGEYLNGFVGCSACGWAQTTVIVRNKPSGGRISVSPNEGSAFQTLFSISAQEWFVPPLSQDIYPLYFTFGYKDSNGGFQLIAPESTRSSLQSWLPSSLDFCPACVSRSSVCTCLQLSVQVRDNLNAIATTKSIDEVLIDRVFNASAQLNSLMEGLRYSIIAKSTFDHVSVLTLQCILLNDKSYNWAAFGVLEDRKREYRNILAQALTTLIGNEALVTQGLLASLSSSLSLLTYIPAEISSSNLGLVRLGLDTLNTRMLAKLQAGEKIVSLYQFEKNGGQVLSSLISSYSAMVDAVSRRQLSSFGEMNSLIASMGSFALLEAQSDSFIDGIVPRQLDLNNFITKVFAISAKNLPGFVADVQAGSFYSSRAPQSRSIPNVRITFPSQTPGFKDPLYALQLSMLYPNPFPVNLQCIDSQKKIVHNFPNVLLPLNNAGLVRLGASRDPVTSFGQRTCLLLGKIIIFNVIISHSPSVFEWPSGVKTTLKLPFDPSLSQEAVMSTTSDGLSGVKLQVSCLRWDAVKASWTAAGVGLIRIAAGNSSLDPFVECEVDGPGVFVASEVPAGCDGIPLSPAVNDECGVCGGENQRCSGCDGLPNSGRSKSCSAHGVCNGNICKCDQGYGGVICQILCVPESNCSGHGVCDIRYQNLEMNSSVYCSCSSGYVPYYQQETGRVDCILELASSEKVPRWAIITIAVVASALLILITTTILLR